MYAKGQGVSQNDAKAAKWFRKAADQDHAAAQSNLGLMYAQGKGVAQNDAEAASGSARQPKRASSKRRPFSA